MGIIIKNIPIETELVVTAYHDFAKVGDVLIMGMDSDQGSFTHYYRVIECKKGNVFKVKQLNWFQIKIYKLKLALKKCLAIT